MLSPAIRAAIPNFITLGRLLAVPVAIWLMVADYMAAAFWLFVAAGVSDALDGFLARRLRVRSVFGSYLDPLADKALLTSVYATLGFLGHIESWLVIMVVFRDVLILGGVVLYLVLAGSLAMQPLLVSKVNTTAQLILVAAHLARLGLGFDDFGVIVVMTYVVAATTFVSGAAYFGIWSWRIVHMGSMR